MCGIVVIHDGTCPTDDSGEGEGDTGQRMLARLRHRGPDSVDFRRVGRTWLGHTRLSIVDVDGGDQPLCNAAGTRWVICNGEIYNHEDLREALPGPFSTDSDSEVALHAVEAWGPEAIGRLRGMYAFAIADAGGGLLAARDALGVKPLYWARADGRTIFASELGAFDPAWRRHVEEFPPGHYWTADDGLVRFAEHAEVEHTYASRSDAHGAIRDTLVAAVRSSPPSSAPSTRHGGVMSRSSRPDTTGRPTRGWSDSPSTPPSRAPTPAGKPPGPRSATPWSGRYAPA